MRVSCGDGIRLRPTVALPPPQHALPESLFFRYASLFFVACIDQDDNELITLEKIHLFVEVLDRYFGNVCELDIIFNFHKAYYILDELFIGGELQVPRRVARWTRSEFVMEFSGYPNGKADD